MSVSGGASYYDQGLMEKVYERRQHWGLPPTDLTCFAALNDNYLGKQIQVTRNNKTLTCYIVDVAQEKHKEAREKDNLIIELDYESYHILEAEP